MNNKIIILLIILQCNTVLSMEQTPSQNQLPQFLKNAKPQWWYLNTVNEYYGGPVSSVRFNPSGTVLTSISGYKETHIFNLQLHQQIASFHHGAPVCSVCFNPTVLATGSRDNKARIFDIQSQQQITSFDHDDWVSSVCFNSSGTLLATGSDDHKARIFARHNDYTVDQLQLKHALLTWLLTEKPNKAINSIEQLLSDIAKKHIIIRPSHLNDEQELVVIGKVWNTFPKNMQAALWRTMLYRIQQYGKVVC